jgi:NADPH-dependent 2,4-dienoyl-CoA reductase/sulfur reductase-like enzyme/nitrite reductase/ring-hydroxylating ferredoxin subunit
MGEQAKLSGPDLSAGVDTSTVTEGSKLLGHANGEAVLLARVGGDFLAIGATCTHYSGPLAEGVIDGDTVRCPWHHACFSLRTGEALRSPALNPVACWKTEQRDGKVFVTEKSERDPLAPTYPAHIAKTATPKNVVIIGGGAAGSAAAEMLRRCGYEGSVTIVDDDTGSPYDRPNLSKDYLAGNAPEEWIPLRPDGFYADHTIDLVRAHVASIDTAKKTIAVEARQPIAYDSLLIATGADPIRLNIPGDDLPHVHFLRSLSDSRSIIAAAKEAKRAVVIGASFIGLEVAASLRARNVAVDVVAPEKLPLERVLGEHLGNFIKTFHESKGVAFHLGRKPQSVDKSSVTLDDGSRLEADLVVMGVGVRPRLDLAEKAGLAMNKGVSVNEFLETSVPRVYAAGDIARWPDAHSGEKIRVEHWVVAQRMGQVAARNILGAREKFDFAPFFWSQHYDVSINYVGHAEKWDSVEVDGEAVNHDVAVRFVRDGKTLALATIFRDEESLKEEIAMEQGD